MIEKLVIDFRAKISQGQRHNILISIADSILFRHSGRKTEEELRKFFQEVNEKLCEPEPLPDDETESIWNSALRFVEDNKKDQQDKEQSYHEQNDLNF
jgi:hypothetical protein